MRKTLCIVLVLITSFAFASFVFAGINESSERNPINTGVSFNNPEPDPYNDYVNAKKTAELKAILTAEKEAGAKGIETAYVACPVRSQITHYWCGLAAAEQVIRANGNSNNLVATYAYNIAVGDGSTISGTYHQFTINSYLGGVDSSGADIDQVTDAINHFSTGSFNWSNIHVSGTGITCANNVLPLYRLTIGNYQKCGVVSVYTDQLSYYNNASYIHYITVNGYGSASGTVAAYFKVVDPHYNSQYQGEHTVQPSEFGSAVSGILDNVIW